MLIAVIGAMLALVVACGGDSGTTATATTTTAPAGGATTAGGIPADVGKGDKADLTGAGATFPAPVYQAWFADYNKIAPGVRVNYQSIGSGGGIQQFTEKTVDFGASDAPMSEEELARAPDAQHIPTVIGAVVMTYNLAGMTAPLKLDGDTVAKIYLGKITKWNDQAIAALNPGVQFPNADIQAVHRSDGAGTTFVFTDWLSKVSADWKAGPGTSKNPSWPAGQGGKGNEGVTAVVRQTPNSIGYVELNYAVANKMPFADIKNKAAKFVTPSIASTSAAAAGATIPADYRVSITNADGDGAYPVASLTYLLVRQDGASCAKTQPLVHLLWWITHDPSVARTATSLDYAPLPASLAPRIDATLKGLKCEGKPALG